VNPLVRLCLVAILSLAATGCVYVNGKNVNLDDWQEVQQDNRELISQLDIGMQRSAVIQKLGTPSDSEAFSHDGEEVRVLFYRTQRKHADGETSRDETTPLVFKNDILIGWGDSVYSKLEH
jgi:hypothetical protein